MEHVPFSDVSSSLSRGSFHVDVQGINVKGTTNNSIAVNFAVGEQTSIWHFFLQPYIVIQKFGFNQFDKGKFATEDKEAGVSSISPCLRLMKQLFIGRIALLSTLGFVFWSFFWKQA